MKTAILAAAIGLAAAGALSAQTATPPTAETSAAVPTVPTDGATTTAPAATATTTAPAATATVGGTDVAISALTPQEFVNRAASSGMFEVMSSELALERAATPSVKEFAQMMVTDHTKANDELKIVAAANGLTVPAEMSGTPADDWEMLQNADAGVFEQSYVDMQIKAHSTAIDLFSAQAQATTNPELSAFAQKTLPTLQSHREMLTGMGG